MSEEYTPRQLAVILRLVGVAIKQAERDIHGAEEHLRYSTEESYRRDGWVRFLEQRKADLAEKQAICELTERKLHQS